MTSSSGGLDVPNDVSNDKDTHIVLTARCDPASSTLSKISAHAIGNMNYLLATDTRRIIALRTIIFGATLHAMNGLPNATAQVCTANWALAMGSDLRLVRIPFVYCVRYHRVPSHHRIHHHRFLPGLPHSGLAVVVRVRDAHEQRQTKSDLDFLNADTFGLWLSSAPGPTGRRVTNVCGLPRIQVRFGADMGQGCGHCRIAVHGVETLFLVHPERRNPFISVTSVLESEGKDRYCQDRDRRFRNHFSFPLKISIRSIVLRQARFPKPTPLPLAVRGCSEVVVCQRYSSPNSLVILFLRVPAAESSPSTL